MRSRLLAFLAAASVLATASSGAASGARAPREGLRSIQLAGTTKPWLVAGNVALPATAPLETQPRAYAALRVAIPAAAPLDVLATNVDSFGDGDRIVRFSQRHQGLPVVGAGASVRLNARGESVLTASSLVDALPASVVPTVSAGIAAATARKLTPITIRDTDAKLVVLATRDGSRLAWAFVPAVPIGVPTAPRILVDAQTGEVLQARDMAQAATAMMYDTNPLKSPTLKSLTLPMAPTDPSGKLLNPFLETLNCAGDGVVKPLSLGGLDFKVRTCELVQTALPSSGSGATAKYDYTPIDDPAKKKESGSDSFSEVSMYYHATRIYEFFRLLQGDPTAQIVLEKPFRAVANLRIDSGLLRAFGAGDPSGLPGPELVPLSNAFYSPAGGGLGDFFGQLYGFSDGSMWFFQGPNKDYAYDGDVVYHEFGHAVVNATIQLESWHLDKYGMIAAPGAMNEGLADYFSAALGGDPDVGEYASKDISASMNVIRTLNNDDKCPTNVVGQVHYDSTVFSGGLWTARESLPAEDRVKLDKGIYKAMRTNPQKGDLGYEDMGNLILATLKTDFPAGAAAVEKSFTDRGLFPACTRIYSYAGKSISPPADSGLPGFTAPGKSTITGAKPAVAPGILQVRVALPESTSKLTFSFDVPRAQGGGGGGGGLGGGGTPFKPVVLAKWGDAITWTTTGKTVSDAEVNVAPVLTGQTYSVTIDVPAGSTVAALQIGNSGDSDGSYKNVSVTTEQAAPVTPEEPPVTTRPDSTPGATPTTTVETSGCGCSVPAQSPRTAGLFVAAFGALALAFRRRRRS